MIKKIFLSALVLALIGCSSLEKTHQFKIDRKSNDSFKMICNPSVENYYEVIVVGKNQFFIERATAPEWVGPLLIPLIPGSLTESISEIRLTFKSNTPANIQEWKLRFESDGLIVSPQISDRQSIFYFPTRSPSEKFQLIVPDQSKVTRIEFVTESSPWTYRPFFIFFGDTFPFYYCNQ